MPHEEGAMNDKALRRGAPAGSDRHTRAAANDGHTAMPGARAGAKTAAAPALAQLRVIKKIAGGARGAKGLTQEYGERLVCIRHRMDATGTRRLTTVELVVSEKAIQPRASPIVSLVVGLHERELQAKVKAAGGRWNTTAKVWRIRRATAVALGLRARILA